MNNGNVKNLTPDEPSQTPEPQPVMKQSVPSHARVRLKTSESHLIVVYSPSSGIGKTTIATNLAAALKRGEERVLLVDCALPAGDVGIFLNLQPQNTLYDLLQDTEHLLPAIANPNPQFSRGTSGEVQERFGSLISSRDLREAEHINLEALMHLIECLRDTFNFIVIDTASNCEALNLGLLRLADHVLLSVCPTLPSIKNARLALAFLDSLAHGGNTIHLVLNSVDTAS